MNKRIWAFVFVIALLIVAAVPAFAAGPSFGPAIYADDQVFSTKGLAELPAPNEHNRQSFDGLFQIPGQLAVAEAAPGNPAFNGGRWIAYQVTWIGEPVLVTSYAQLMELKNAGELDFSATGSYFECPLLPVKS